MKNIFLIVLFSLLGVQLVVASDVTDIFEPFQTKTHKKLIKKFGVEETTELYHEYIEEKKMASLIGTLGTIGSSLIGSLLSKGAETIGDVASTKL